jgi:hypothetical protein
MADFMKEDLYEIFLLGVRRGILLTTGATEGGEINSEAEKVLLNFDGWKAFNEAYDTLKEKGYARFT